MQKIVHGLLVATVITLASCGAANNDSAPLKEKKAQLEALKKQQTTIAGDITKLEKELAKLDPASAKEEKAKLVTVTPITTETFNHFIDLQGKVESENISYVTPRGGGGQVKAIFVKRGDNVTKGKLLLKLDDAVARQSLAAAQQNIESVKTSLAFAKNIYQKQKNLWDQNIGTEVQLITAKNNMEAYENQLKTLQAQLNITKEQLAFTNVYSDVNGVADDVNIRVGELFVGAGQIKIVNTSNLKVTAQIPENYLQKVKVGSRIKVTLPDINKTIEAVITVAGKLIDPNSRSFFIEAKIPTDKDFRPNQIALVKIQDYSAPNAIAVPVNTLQNDEKGKFVMVAVEENGKKIARKKSVTIGELYGAQLEIKSGLQVGDAVITDGFQGLYDGQLLTTTANN